MQNSQMELLYPVWQGLQDDYRTQRVIDIFSEHDDTVRDEKYLKFRDQ